MNIAMMEENKLVYVIIQTSESLEINSENELLKKLLLWI